MIFPGLIDPLFAEGITLVLGMTGLATMFVFLPLTLFRLRRLGDIRRGGLAGIGRILLEHGYLLRLLVNLGAQLTTVNLFYLSSR
jgi:hypothetical protein